MKYSNGQEIEKIQILNAGFIDYDEKKLGKEIKRLSGSVSIKHEGAIMFCDSAYFNTEKNTVKAFSNVHINQGDTIHLFGDFINYDGNTKIAKVRKHVKMTHDESVLTTDSLNYDRNTNIGYYFNKGKITDKKDILTSEKGYYYSEVKDFIAVENVVLVNPEYKMYSDTLKFNITTEIAYFLGPTNIIGDSTSIYCENGWYNTQSDISQYNKNAFIVNRSQTLKGDSLYYENKTGFGKAYNNVVITDTSQHVILKGNYATYYKNPEKSMITDSALFIKIVNNDSLFVHSDTIRFFSDSSGNDKIIKAYYKVKIFKSDIQSKCDSLVYLTKDSVFRLFRDPVIWSDKNQLTADYIEIHTKNNKPDFIILENAAFIISREDTIRFNQIKGKNMKGYFKDDKLYRIDVNGNAQAIYFPKDKEKLIGVNTSDCSNMNIYLKNNEVERIIFLTKPNAILHPINELPAEKLKLKNFIWLEEFRPLEMEDVFQ